MWSHASRRFRRPCAPRATRSGRKSARRRRARERFRRRLRHRLRLGRRAGSFASGSPGESTPCAVRLSYPADATLVSVIAYAGLRCPEEALALEWRHVGGRTLLVEQRNIDGEIVAGQKVRGASPRSVELAAPLRQDLAGWRLACGRPADSQLVFPRLRRRAVATPRLEQLATPRLEARCRAGGRGVRTAV